MTAEIKFGELLGHLTDDKVPTDVPFPDAAVFQQLINQLLGPFLGFYWKNEKGQNPRLFELNCLVGGFLGQILSILRDGQDELAELFHVAVLMFQRIFGSIFDPVHNYFHEFLVRNLEVVTDLNLLIQQSV